MGRVRRARAHANHGLTSGRTVHPRARSGRRTSGDNRPVAEERIRVGDTVVLKTGGSAMTVQALSMSLAYCAWTAAGQPRHGTFEVDTLEVVSHRPKDSAAGKGGTPRSA